MNTKSPSTVRPIKRRSVRVLIVTLCCLVATLAGVLFANSASAYYGTSSGSVGKVAWTTMGGTIRSLPGYTFYVPDVMVYHNNAVPLRYQQTVTLVVEMQRWTGNGWASAGYLPRTQVTGSYLDDPTLFERGSITSNTRTPGYYRVVFKVIWRSSMIPDPSQDRSVTGSLLLEPNQNLDLSCANNAGHCSTNGSYFYLNG